MDALPCLEGPATIDDVSDAGRERTLVDGEIERERSDFVRCAEPPHRLPRDEHVPAAWACRGGALQHRRRLDRAGADAIATDALRYEVDGNRAGEGGNRGLG